MVSITFLVALLSFSSTLVKSAPVPALDADTLLQNGIDAQRLNGIFQSIRSTDACNSGDIACVEGATAQCVDGAWQLTECPASQSCFVLPSIRERASFITCTSERSALSIIESTGATGGITGGAIAGPPSETINPGPAQPSETTSAFTTASENNNGGTVTITVTVTTLPGTIPPAPLPSTTDSLGVISTPQASGPPQTLGIPRSATTQPISSQPPTFTIRLTAARALQTETADSATASFPTNSTS